VKRWLLLLAVNGVGGCPQAPPPPSCNIDGGSTLAIGNGNPNNPTVFRALSDGATVNLVPGNQGGQHVWVVLHAQNICPDHPSVRLEVIRASDGVVVGFSRFGGNHWNELADAPGVYSSVPMAAAIDEDQYCPLVHGGMVRIAVQLDDQMGHVLNGTVAVTIDSWTPDASPTERASREACCADYTNTMCWPNGPPDAGGLDAGDAANDAGDATVDGE
jgi:hypothetical protein